MISILSEAFEKAATLPEPLQRQVALQLFEDMEADLKWDRTFSNTQLQLSKMADKALEDFNSGRGKNIGIDEL